MKKVDLYTSILKKLSSQKEQNITSLSFLNEIIYYTTRMSSADLLINKIVDVISKYLGSSAIYLLDENNKTIYRKYSTIQDLPETVKLDDYDGFIALVKKKSVAELNVKQMNISQDIKGIVSFYENLTVLPLSVRNTNSPLGVLIIDVDLYKTELTKLQALNTAIVLISNSISYASLINNSELTARRVIKLILKIMLFDDLSTYRHSLRVEKYSTEMAKLLSLPRKSIKRLRISALLHDLGKITIPYNILHKEEKLSYEEFELIKQHTIIGYNLVRDFPFFKEMLPDILNHHEKLDGSGYPNGIKELDTATQILAVADIVDAIASTRAYKDDKGFSYITEEVEKLKGKYDEKIVDAAISFINSNKFLMLKKRFKSSEGRRETLEAVSIGNMQEKINKLKEENKNISKQVDLYKKLLAKTQKSLEDMAQKTRSVGKDSEIYKAVIKTIFDSIKPVSIVFLKVLNETLNIVRVKGEPINLENSIQILSNKKIFSAILSDDMYISRKIVVFPIFGQEAACAFLSKDAPADEKTAEEVWQSLKNIIKSKQNQA